MISQAPCSRGKLRAAARSASLLSPRSTAGHLGAQRAATRARWGPGKSLTPAPHTTSTKWTPASSHNRCTSRLTPSRSGFILEPHRFIRTADLPKAAQISLLSGGSVKHRTVRDAPEDTGGLQRRARSEASGMMQPWCGEIAGL